MTLSTGLLVFVGASYLAAFASYVHDFSKGIRRPVSWGSRLIEAGFLVHTLQIFAYTFSVSRSLQTHLYFPVGTLPENSTFFAWSLGFVYLILVKRHQTEGFGLVLSPLLLLFLIPAIFPSTPTDAIVPYLDDNYFLLHILSAFFGYSSFTLSFAAGILYLVQDRALKLKTHLEFYHQLPPLEALERFIFRTIFWGLVLLGVAILTGGLWTLSSFGTFILIEPKSLATIFTWCFYLVLIYLHEVASVKGRRVMLVSVWAFGLVLFTFIGTSVMKSGLHA
jgi:ABC-type uncharacterized transport system permease subunit